MLVDRLAGHAQLASEQTYVTATILLGPILDHSGTHFLKSNIRMVENKVVEPRILEVLERVKGSSKPNIRDNL